MDVYERDAGIIHMRQRGAKYSAVASRYGMTPAGARQVFERHKRRVEEAGLGLLRGAGLDTKTARVVGRAIGVVKPTLMDLRTFISKNTEWKRRILCAEGGGRVTVEKVEAFARHHGIIG